MADDGCTHDDWQATATLYRDEGLAVVLEMTCVTCLTPMVWETAETTSATAVAVAIRLPCHPFAVQAREGGA